MNRFLFWISLYRWLSFSSSILILKLDAFLDLRLLSYWRLEQGILCIKTGNKIWLFNPRVFSNELIDNHCRFEIGYIFPLILLDKVADLGFDVVLDPHVVWSWLATLMSFHATFNTHHFVQKLFANQVLGIPFLWHTLTFRLGSSHHVEVFFGWNPQFIWSNFKHIYNNNI